MAVSSACVENPAQAAECERVSGTRAEAALVEDGDRFPLGVVIEQHLDLRNHVLRGLPRLPRIQRHRDGECGCRATSEPYGNDDVALAQERDIVDQQCEHAFAVAIRRLRIPPERGEVPGQLDQTAAVLFAQCLVIAGPLMVASFLLLVQSAPLSSRPFTTWRRAGSKP